MADATAQKLKLANSRKRFKELQELKKKKYANQNPVSTGENVSQSQTPANSLTSSTHSSINEHLGENVSDSCINTQLPNYFSTSNYGDNPPQPAVFFDNFSQVETSENCDTSEVTIADNSNMFKYFNSTSPQTSLVENVASSVIETPHHEAKQPLYPQNYTLFSQNNQHSYVAETQQILHPNQDELSIDDPEIEQNEIYNLHKNKTEGDRYSATNRQDLVDYLQNDNKETINECENQAIKNEITQSSNLAQAEVQHSSVESLKQLSDQMAQLIEPEYAQYSSSITDLEKRNLELASLLEQEKLKSEQQRPLINDLQARIAQIESENRAREEHSSLQMKNELSRLNEELQCHIQTVGLLVAEKTELSANLSQLELTSKQKNSECEELQARLKASRSRVADLERELNILKTEKSRNENAGLEQSEAIAKLKNDYNSFAEHKEELIQDLLEVREKLKNSSEENMKLQQQNRELSGKLSLANIKIQQIANGEQAVVGDQIEKLTQEKFELEKQLSNLNLMLKTITKERDESSVQYQQYAQQLNAQITNLSSRLEQLQQENENFSVQEQNRVKHISELERKLQNLQNEQVAFATNRTNGDTSMKVELDNTRELCVQLQIEKTSAEENLTKTLNEKEMLLKELAAKNDSLSQLESMVEQLRGNQPDSVKLLATMESDKVAAARAVQQNKELKEQMESMQEVFMKLDKDKVDLTDKLNLEHYSNKELLDKLQKVELQLQRLTDAIEIKDRELSSLRETSAELNKLLIHQEQLTDRLRHYEAQDNSSYTLQNELQEAKQTIVKLVNEINVLKNAGKTTENTDVLIVKTVDEHISENGKVDHAADEIERIHRNTITDHSMDNNFNKDDDALDREAAMRHLEEKFKRTMQDIADLTEEKQRLEHLVLQLQGETETIGEYVALYQHQRMVLKQKAFEKDQQLKQLANDRQQIKSKLEKLNNLIKKLVVEKGEVPQELLLEHKNLTSQSDNFCEQHSKIHNEINKMNDEGKIEINGTKNSETAEEIIALLSEIKSSNLVQPDENFHHCPWCSGQLITV